MDKQVQVTLVYRSDPTSAAVPLSPFKVIFDAIWALAFEQPPVKPSSADREP